VSKDDRPDAEPDDLPVLARPLQEYVGRNLRAYRRHKGITQERAAELLGVDVRYLRRIETGQMNLQLQTIDHTGGTWDEDTVTDQG
jgi:DNA-binding XRE family transcriptional regulator